MNREQEWLLRDKYQGAECEAFRADCARLESGEPLAYIIGWVPFLTTKIYLDSKPLIPRPETEYWTAKAIAEINQSGNSSPKILDLCAGSGCIGIAMLAAVPDAACDFAELDRVHHATILKNVRENGIDESRIRIMGGSLFENVHDTYDVIVTNPPYIDPELSLRVEESVINHEPHLALFGGSAGMEPLSEIVQEAPAHLNPGGVLYLEHEPEQEFEIKKLLAGTESFPDQYGIARYSVWKKSP